MLHPTSCLPRRYKQLISKHPQKRPSELYGGEHFLRLAVKLPQLLLEVCTCCLTIDAFEADSQAKLEADMLETMQGKITELLKFLQRNSHKYILGDYRSAPPGVFSQYSCTRHMLCSHACSWQNTWKRGKNSLHSCTASHHERTKVTSQQLSSS